MHLRTPLVLGPWGSVGHGWYFIQLPVGLPVGYAVTETSRLRNQFIGNVKLTICGQLLGQLFFIFLESAFVTCCMYVSTKMCMGAAAARLLGVVQSYYSMVAL